MRGVRFLKLVLILSVFAFVLSCGQSNDPNLLSNNRGVHSDPVYSPDGKYIAYVFRRDAYVIDANGNSRQKITGGFFSKESVDVITWISNEQLAYINDEGDNDKLYVYNLVSNTKNLIYSWPNPVYYMNWNPKNDNLIALVMNQSEDQLNPSIGSIYILNTDTGESFPVSGNYDIGKAEWTSTGEEVISIHDGQLFKLNIKTKEIEEHPFHKGQIRNFSIVGEKILYNRLPSVHNNYQEGIYITSIDFSDPVEVWNDSVVEFDWSPNGNEIVYTTVGVPGKNQLKKVDLQTWVDSMGKQSKQ